MFFVENCNLLISQQVISRITQNGSRDSSRLWDFCYLLPNLFPVEASTAFHHLSNKIACMSPVIKIWSGHLCEPWHIYTIVWEIRWSRFFKVAGNSTAWHHGVISAACPWRGYLDRVESCYREFLYCRSVTMTTLAGVKVFVQSSSSSVFF